MEDILSKALQNCGYHILVPDLEPLLLLYPKKVMQILDGILNFYQETLCLWVWDPRELWSKIILLITKTMWLPLILETFMLNTVEFIGIMNKIRVKNKFSNSLKSEYWVFTLYLHLIIYFTVYFLYIYYRYYYRFIINCILILSISHFFIHFWLYSIYYFTWKLN